MNKMFKNDKLLLVLFSAIIQKQVEKSNWFFVETFWVGLQKYIIAAALYNMCNNLPRWTFMVKKMSYQHISTSQIKSAFII